MDLYFAPLSCSLATRIAIYEAGPDAGFHQVVLSAKQTTSGADYLKVNPKGQVPALVTEQGILTEGPACGSMLPIRRRPPGLRHRPARVSARCCSSGSTTSPLKSIKRCTS